MGVCEGIAGNRNDPKLTIGFNNDLLLPMSVLKGTGMGSVLVGAVLSPGDIKLHLRRSECGKEYERVLFPELKRTKDWRLLPDYDYRRGAEPRFPVGRAGLLVAADRHG
jgi:hypothetical protein